MNLTMGWTQGAGGSSKNLSPRENGERVTRGKKKPFSSEERGCLWRSKIIKKKFDVYRSFLNVTQRVQKPADT
jgi:hypothetical protein